MRWARYIACIVETKNLYKILVGIHEGELPLRRHRRRWEDNIKMDLKETEFKNVDWICLFQDRDRRWVLVNTVMNFQVP
jgi:hypothetical protein